MRDYGRCTVTGVSAADELLLEVARCPNVRRCFDSSRSQHVCSKVVAAQRTGRETFHLPEPWNGEIETAPLLFVSWNPSWNPDERFPTEEWTDTEIARFFRQRFQHTGQRSQTWREIRGIAEHLLGREPRPGVDYAITDVVRCKSRKGEGASEALTECSSRYLRRTLDASGARVIVALGRDARRVMADHFGVPAAVGACVPVSRERRERVLVLLGAPGSAQPRRLPSAELMRARAALSAGERSASAT